MMARIVYYCINSVYSLKHMINTCLVYISTLQYNKFANIYATLFTCYHHLLKSLYCRSSKRQHPDGELQYLTKK